MKRVEHRDERGRLVSIELTDRETDDTALAIEVQSAPPALLRIAVGGRPAIWARVWDDLFAWSWLAPRESPEIGWPCVRASTARAAARRAPGSDAWLGFWIDAWWDAIALTTARTRGRIDIVPARADGLRWYSHLHAPDWSTARVGDDVPRMWDPGVLPMHAWPREDDARVKAYRKLARAGELPPIVLRWVSGLCAYLVVDGHARVIAAALEHVVPHALAIVPVYVRSNARPPQWTERAVATLEALTSSPDGKTRVRALDAINRVAMDRVSHEWLAIERARPIPGGARAWRAEVARLQTRAPDPSVAEMLAPFERPRRTGFVW